MIIYLEDSKNFEKEISEGTVLVDFYADWCSPCQMLGKVLEEVSEQDNVKIVKINTDIFTDIAQAFRIMSIPAVFLFKDGKLVNKSVGYMPIESVREFIK